MEKQAEQIESSTPPQQDSHLPETARPLTTVEQHISPKQSNQTETKLQYKADWLESLSIGEKTGLGVGILLLIGGYIGVFGSPVPPEYLLTTVISLLVLTVTIAQAYINKRQWYGVQKGLEKTDALIEQAERQLELMEETFYVSERAYVGIGKISIPENTIGLDSHGFIRFKLKLVNGGRTPAFNVRVRSFQCNTHIFDSDGISDAIIKQGKIGLKNAKNQSVERIILAGRSETIWHSPAQTLSGTYHEAWIANSRYVFIPVKLSYEDIHGDTHSLIYWYQFWHGRGFFLQRPLVLKVSKCKKRANEDKKAN